MFENQEQLSPKPSSFNFNHPDETKIRNKKMVVVILAALMSIMAISGGVWFKFLRKTASVVPAIEQKAEQPVKKISTSTLPGGIGNGDAVDANGHILTEEELKAENLAFAQFYKPETEDFKQKQFQIKLPIFAKTDLANYYDISRKIDLDKVIEKINRDGFALLDNPFAKEANDFYKVYELLAQKELPQFVSGDFLLYYYQNSLKETYKEIESNVFYQDVWTISKDFFDLASARYRKRRDLVGAVNDPVLEAERLEAGFFAVSLELLKAKPEQIDELNRSLGAKFSAKEAADFDFTAPDYLAEEVAKEVALINRGNEAAKSPIFLYQKNYSDFKVPAAYKENSRLNNYFLASNWLKSSFPLYYKSNDCPNCLLDKNDWLINFIAASLIARDFADNQELKNYWAKVYKILSFFQGIRKELTYLNYQQVFKTVYGETYNPEVIFSDALGRPAFDSALATAEKLAGEIRSGFNFSEIVGGLNRSLAANKPKIGMRLLQENYWPNDYIGSRLTGGNVGNYLGVYDRFNAQTGAVISGCEVGREKKFERCTIIGLDVINLFKPVSSQDKYFLTNSNYKNYQSQINEIKTALGKFNAYDWHENNYWTTLDIINKNLLLANHQPGPVYVSNQAWQEKEVNTALGIWLNLAIPADRFGLGSFETSGFGGRSKMNSYIEPNLELINELSANSKMLAQMFSVLKLGKDAGFTAKRLNELVEYLDKTRAIVKKELNGELLDESDQLLISDLIRQTMIVKAADKNLKMQFKNNSIKESLDGVKLVTVVLSLPNSKILSIGPVFNYREGK